MTLSLALVLGHFGAQVHEGLEVAGLLLRGLHSLGRGFGDDETLELRKNNEIDPAGF